jgi:hypothetical protein
MDTTKAVNAYESPAIEDRQQVQGILGSRGGGSYNRSWSWDR